MKPTTLILDMDEIITDFVSAACIVHGTTRDKLHTTWTPGDWDMCKPLDVSVTKFWAEIDECGIEFWKGLHPTPWLEDLMLFCEREFEEIHIVTAPSRSEHCYHGKIWWLREYFGSTFNNFCITPHKHIFANERSVILDDRETTIKKFVGHGGKGILFPAFHNSLHVQRDNPLPYVFNEILNLGD